MAKGAATRFTCTGNNRVEFSLGLPLDAVSLLGARSAGSRRRNGGRDGGAAPLARSRAPGVVSGGQRGGGNSRRRAARSAGDAGAFRRYGLLSDRGLLRRASPGVVGGRLLSLLTR